MVLALDLVIVQLTGKGCYMSVGSVAPHLKEVCLDGELLLCCDNVPCLVQLDHRLDGLIILTHVVLVELFQALRVDGRDNGFDRHGI